MNYWKIKKNSVSLSTLSVEERKAVWKAHSASAIGKSQIYHPASTNEYNFLAGKKNSTYAKVLNYLRENGSASKFTILKDVFNIEKEPRYKEAVARCKKNGWNYNIDKAGFLRGQYSCLFSALSLAELAKYSHKTKEWEITDLGKWYLDNCLR